MPAPQPPSRTVTAVLTTWIENVDQAFKKLIDQNMSSAEKVEFKAEAAWMKTLPPLTDGTIIEITESLKTLRKLRDRPARKKSKTEIQALRDREIREIAFLILTDKNNDRIYCNWTMVTGMVLFAATAAVLVAAAILPPVAIVVGAAIGAVIGVGAKRLAAHHRSYWCCMFTEPPQMNNQEAQKTVLRKTPAVK